MRECADLEYTEDLSLLLSFAKKYRYSVSTLLASIGQIMRCGIYALDSNGLCIGGYVPNQLNSGLADEINLTGRISYENFSELMEKRIVYYSDVRHELFTKSPEKHYPINILIIASELPQDKIDTAVQCVVDYILHLSQMTSGNLTDISLLNQSLNEIFSGKIKSEEQIRTILNDWREKPYYGVFAIGFEDGTVNYKRFLRFVSELQKIVIGCKATIYQGCILCLVTSNPPSPTHQNLVRASWAPTFFKDGHDFASINSLLTSMNAQLVHNAPLKNLINLPSIAASLIEALKIAKKFTLVSQYSHIHPLEEYHILIIEKDFLERWLPRNNPSSLKYLLFPDITPLLYYDYTHKQNLSEFLFKYFLLGSDVSKTAKNLYMHKNTVYNKLNQIEKIINVDLKNTNDLTLIMDSLKLYFFAVAYFDLNLPEILFGNPEK